MKNSTTISNRKEAYSFIAKNSHKSVIIVETVVPGPVGV
jgi:hypothetical protein